VGGRVKYFQDSSTESK